MTQAREGNSVEERLPKTMSHPEVGQPERSSFLLEESGLIGGRDKKPAWYKEIDPVRGSSIIAGVRESVQLDGSDDDLKPGIQKLERMFGDTDRIDTNVTQGNALRALQLATTQGSIKELTEYAHRFGTDSEVGNRFAESLNRVGLAAKQNEIDGSFDIELPLTGGRNAEIKIPLTGKPALTMHDEKTSTPMTEEEFGQQLKSYMNNYERNFAGSGLYPTKEQKLVAGAQSALLTNDLEKFVGSLDQLRNPNAAPRDQFSQQAVFGLQALHQQLAKSNIDFDYIVQPDGGREIQLGPYRFSSNGDKISAIKPGFNAEHQFVGAPVDARNAFNEATNTLRQSRIQL